MSGNNKTEGHLMSQDEIEEFNHGIDAAIRRNPDWVTHGWSREPNTGAWIELGTSKGVTSHPSPIPPEIGIHDVAAELNKRESQIKDIALRMAGGFASTRDAGGAGMRANKVQEIAEAGEAEA